MILELNEQEFESLVDMCVMALTVVNYSGGENQDEAIMISLFNRIAELKGNGVKVTTNERFERLNLMFFDPYLDRHRRLIDEETDHANEVDAVIVAENVEPISEAKETDIGRNNFWG